MSLFRYKADKNKKYKTTTKSGLHSTRKLKQHEIHHSPLGATKFFKQTAFYVGDTV